MRPDIIVMLKELINKGVCFLLKDYVHEYAEDAIQTILRSKLLKPLKQNKLKESAPPKFGETLKDITNNLLSEVLGPTKLTHAALKAKKLKMGYRYV
jgi:hypothetical protein